MKTILITGATGYLGNALLMNLYTLPDLKIRLLMRKTSSLKGDYPNCEIFYGDVTDYNSVSAAVNGCDTVFHVASCVTVSSKDDGKIYNVNVNGTKNICAACKENNVEKLIYVSSSSVLKTNKNGVTTEECGYRDSPVGVYDKTKKEATLIVKDYVKSGRNANTVYPTAIIGPYDYGTNLSNTALKMPVDTPKNGIMLTFGANDFVDVEDVVNGIIAVYKNGAFGEDYILSGHYLKLTEIGEAVNRIRNGKMKCINVPLFLIKFACFLTDLYCKLFKKSCVLTKQSIETVSEGATYSHEKADKIGYTVRSIDETVKNGIEWFSKQ